MKLRASTLALLLGAAAMTSCGGGSDNVGTSGNTNVSSATAQLVKNARPNIAAMRGSYSSFSEWKALFRARALASGITAETFDRAAPYMKFQQRIVHEDRNQAEVKQSMMEYVEKRVSDTRIGLGNKAMRQYGSQLRAIATAYNIDPSILAGIWGMETNYGGFMGGINVFEALSTLSYEGRRRNWAEIQLVHALKIVQNGDRTPEKMEGSWAGGMGHTQFIPESFTVYAVDYTGDGKRDLWNPIDALASSANYLRGEATAPGLAWGAEVKLPSGFNRSQAGLSNFKPASYWKDQGVTSISKRGIPNANVAIFIPEGSNGRAFAVTSNFASIKRYNNSTSYALAVALLGDAVMGY